MKKAWFFYNMKLQLLIYYTLLYVHIGIYIYAFYFCSFAYFDFFFFYSLFIFVFRFSCCFCFSYCFVFHLLFFFYLLNWMKQYNNKTKMAEIIVIVVVVIIIIIKNSLLPLQHLLNLPFNVSVSASVFVFKLLVFPVFFLRCFFHSIPFIYVCLLLMKTRRRNIIIIYKTLFTRWRFGREMGGECWSEARKTNREVLRQRQSLGTKELMRSGRRRLCCNGGAFENENWKKLEKMLNIDTNLFLISLI